MCNPGRHRSVHGGLAFVESLILVVAIAKTGVAVRVVARNIPITREKSVAAVEIALNFLPIVGAAGNFGTGTVVGVDFFLRHDLQIRHGYPASHIIDTLCNGIIRIAACTCACEHVVKRPETVVADTGFDFQAFGRPPIEDKLRPPFLAPPCTRAGELG